VRVAALPITAGGSATLGELVAAGILVEPSAHRMVNVGDTAMLEVAVGRLHELWPEASIGVNRCTGPPRDPLARHRARPRSRPAPVDLIGLRDRVPASLLGRPRKATTLR
jgi:hypothetical protein